MKIAINNQLFWLGLILLSILSYFIIFLNLGSLSLEFWDEPVYAINAFRFLQHPHPIMVYDYWGNSELFSPKPPFHVWCIALSYKIFGVNEFAIRFPTAIFTLGTFLSIYFFCGFFLKNNFLAFAASLIFLSSIGFYQLHITRTGDTDATFVFFAVFSSICFFILCSNCKNFKLANYLFWLGLTLGVYTKGPAILALVPCYIVWFLLNKINNRIAKNIHFYIGMVSFLVLSISYYLLREHLNPGYLQAVFNQEISGRLMSNSLLQSDAHPWFYYIERMYKENYFMPWIILIPFCIIIHVLSKQSTEKKLATYCYVILTFLCFLIFKADVKKAWYDAVLYPFLALYIASVLAAFLKDKNQINTLVMLFVMLLLSAKSSLSIINKNNSPIENHHLKKFVENLRAEKKYNQTIRMFNLDYNYYLYYYFMLDKEKGYNNKEITSIEYNQAGDTIAVMTEAREIDLRKKFELDEIYRHKDCALFLIKDLKRN